MKIYFESLIGRLGISRVHGPSSLMVFWAYDPNLVKIMVALILRNMIRWGHNFAHATTAELSWHVQNWDLQTKSEWIFKILITTTGIFTRFQSWPHKVLVGWVPGCHTGCHTTGIVTCHTDTVHPKGRAHCSCFAMFGCVLLWVDVSSKSPDYAYGIYGKQSTVILQGYFT